MGPKALQFIHAIARKLLSKRSEGIASIGNKMQAEAKAGEIAAIFQESGLPMNRLDDFIKSEKDVVKYLNIIEESKKKPLVKFDNDDLSTMSPDSAEGKRISELLMGPKKADVFDLKGNRIKNTDNIMGGEEIKIKDSALYEDRGENIIPTQFKDTTVSPERVAQGFSTQMKLNNAETNKLLAQDLIQGKSSEFNNLTMEAKSDIINKINIEIKKEPQKFYQGGQAKIEPDLSGIGHGSNALMSRNMQLSPGSQATTSTGLNYLLGEDNDTTRVPYKHGDMVLPKPKPMDEYLLKQVMSQAGANTLTAETRQMLIEELKEKIRNKNSKADGGRTEFSKGKLALKVADKGRRGFMKAAGAGAAGIAALKTGLLGFGEKIAPVAKETVAAAGEAFKGVPPYFLNLVKKIKSLGDDVTETYATQDRQKVTKYKDFELTEDVSTGRVEIQRVKVADDMDYYGSPITEETYMGYSPGEEIFQETAKGKTKIIKTQPKYEEGTTYLRNDGPETGSVLDESTGISDDIFKEVGEEVPEIIRKGKADGGRIGYGKGDIVTKGIPALIKKVNKLFGKEVVTTADKLKTPQKTLDREMFNAADKRINKKRQLTNEEIQDYEMELGDSETWMSEGTLGEAENALKNYKSYEAEMYQQYKMGKLDPVAGDKSPARKRFLEQKLADMEASGDKRLMTRDEIEELSTFDLGVEMQTLRDGKTKSIIPKDEYAEYKNDFDKEILNKEIKAGVDDVMRDTSPAGLEKSIEIDNLMLKYPGMDKNLADQIASSSPTMKADMIAMVEQTFKMDEMGMSGDDIIQSFKNTPRTKQATGGLANLLGE